MAGHVQPPAATSPRLFGFAVFQSDDPGESDLIHVFLNCFLVNHTTIGDHMPAPHACSVNLL